MIKTFLGMYLYFPNTISGYWIPLDTSGARALNFFGQPWRGLFWVACPVKPLYSLGHCASAQFQGLGNLLIAYTIFM